MADLLRANVEPNRTLVLNLPCLLTIPLESLNGIVVESSFCKCQTNHKAINTTARAQLDVCAVTLTMFDLLRKARIIKISDCFHFISEQIQALLNKWI